MIRPLCGQARSTLNGLRSLAGNFQEHRLQLLEARGEIGKDLRRNLSLASLGPENACDGQILPGYVFRQCPSAPHATPARM